MWIIVLGVIAIVATFLNLYLYQKSKRYHVAMAIGLSFTALTVVSMYSGIAGAVQAEDWAGIMDVVPTMSTVLWILTISSILLNLLPVFLDWKNGR